MKKGFLRAILCMIATSAILILQAGYKEDVQDLFKLLDKKNFSTKKDLPKVLQLINKKGNEALVTEIEPGRDTKIAQTALIIASRNGFVDVVAALIDKKTDVNKKVGNITPLSVAIDESNYSVVQALLKAGAHPNFQLAGRTPLHRAAMKKDPKLVEILLSYGADPKREDSDEKTPRARWIEAGGNAQVFNDLVIMHNIADALSQLARR
ncbi:MAG: ankyrin repeat domain-containing protein [Candidatus Babeliaceae bacterium]|nr:ankyrin repeat domain-containing protein [Candidatus Babeliaceae bacterium]